jgi:branched-chain amino acid transport system substrate-binding protein
MWRALTALAVLALASANAMAEETVKVGLILPMTGPFTTTGKQVEAGARFYMQQNGATVDGRKIELILRDDAGVADNSRRIAQQLLAVDKVNILAGFGLTPIALAVAPLATETKTPMVVMAAATAIVTERSPYIVRSSFPQAAPVVIIADWEAKHGLKKVATVVSDFAPGHDSETYFKETFTAPAVKSHWRCGCPCSIRISRRSCSACTMPPRTGFTSSFRPAKPRP